MKLLSLDIPDDRDSLARWIEDRLLGLDLRELVIELAALREDGTASRSLSDICGPDLPQALESGLASLPAETLRDLLQNPQTLLELQEQVFIDGGEYWSTAEASPPHRRAIDTGWHRLQRAIATQPATPATEDPAAPSTTPTSRTSRRRILTLTSTAAAALLVSGAIWMTLPASPVGWGFNRPDALTADLSAPDYLNHLAAAASEWFNRPPDTRESLQQRLTEFRAGCDTLLTATHPQLSDTDRTWLQENCRKWRAEIDTHLNDLKTEVPTEVVSVAADSTIELLVAELTHRANTAAA